VLLSGTGLSRCVPSPWLSPVGLRRRVQEGLSPPPLPGVVVSIAGCWGRGHDWVLRVPNSLPVWAEEAGVICPPALCATTALSPSVGPLALRDPQDLLTEGLGRGDERCRAGCLARGLQGASLTRGWGWLTRPGRFWRTRTLRAPRRCVCRSSSSRDGGGGTQTG